MTLIEILAIGALFGAISGALIKLTYSRASGGKGRPLPLSRRDGLTLQVLLAAYTVAVTVLLVALAVIGSVVSTLPYVVVAILAGIGLARVVYVRTCKGQA